MLNILESQGMQIVLRKWCFVIRTVFTSIYRTPEQVHSWPACVKSHEKSVCSDTVSEIKTVDQPIWNIENPR